MNRLPPRLLHAVTALVALVAVVWQLALVVSGDAVLADAAPPSMSTRLIRFVSYFTIQSNLLVLVTSWLLARDPGRDGPLWRVVRMNAVVGITVTGVVHWFFLRPILDLSGSSYVVDKLLHVVVPLVAVLTWLLVGPRGQATRAQVLPSLVWPLLWAVYTLVRGVVTDWYPYPFVDANELGYPRTLANFVGIAGLLGLVGIAMVALDQRLGRREPAPA